MDLNEFAKEVHALAVEKGFYDPEPTDAELIAAIHSEISEAFEEWRAGRPMVHYDCGYSHENDPQPCIRMECSNWNDKDCFCYDCGTLKPEGIAVELIDVVLRILDAAAAWGYEIIDSDIRESIEVGLQAHVNELSLPELIAALHYAVSMVFASERVSDRRKWLDTILSAVFASLSVHDIDPEALMLEKHEYNKTRPYRHGGKRV